MRLPLEGEEDDRDRRDKRKRQSAPGPSSKKRAGKEVVPEERESSLEERTEDDDDEEEEEEEEEEDEDDEMLSSDKEGNAGAEEDESDIDAMEELSSGSKGKGIAEETDEESSKFWRIKCKTGQEKEAVSALARKRLDSRNTKRILRIKSAIAPLYTPRCIIIESDKNTAKKACKGLSMLKMSTMTPISREDLSEILCASENSEFKAKDYVRIKNGYYKGDIAEVLEIRGSKLRIKLVPRIDLVEIQGRAEKKGKREKNKHRPPKLVSLKDATAMNIPVKSKKDSQGRIIYSFNNMDFWDGYLIKLVPIKSVEPATKPQAEHSGLDSLIKGDEVIVVEGIYKDALGQVVKVDADGDTVFVRFDRKSKEAFLLHRHELRKHYEAGAHVRVASGTHAGSTGIILNVENDHLVISSDMGKEEIRVPKECLKDTADATITRVATVIGDYQVQDLVWLNHSTYGMILSMEKDAFRILKGNAERIEILSVKPRDVQKKILDKNATALDALKNVLHLKAMVRVQSGLFRGKQGVVEHIHGGLLFINDKQYLENGGYLCARADSCVLFGGEGSQQSLGFKVPAPVGAPRLRHPLVGKKVKVRKGQYKGYRGEVVRSFNTNLHVFVGALLKEVTVPHDHVIAIETAVEGATVQQSYPENASQQGEGWGDGSTSQQGDGWGDGGTSQQGDGWGDGGTSQQGDGWGDGGTSQQGDGWGDGGTSQQGDGWGDGSTSQQSNDGRGSCKAQEQGNGDTENAGWDAENAGNNDSENVGKTDSLQDGNAGGWGNQEDDNRCASSCVSQEGNGGLASLDEQEQERDALQEDAGQSGSEPTGDGDDTREQGEEAARNAAEQETSEEAKGRNVQEMEEDSRKCEEENCDEAAAVREDGAASKFLNGDP